MELQGLLDEWLIACWQNRPHDGLRDPAAPGRAFTPNEKYAALVQAAGYVPVALSAGDYIELLPATWRAINAYGVKISHRIYDSEELNPFRGQRSGVAAKQNRGRSTAIPTTCPGSGSVTTGTAAGSPCSGSICPRRPSRSVSWPGTTPAQPRPATAGIWRNKRSPGPCESLLQRAHQGPGKPGRPGRKPAAKDRRVAARTRATAQPSWPRPAQDGEPRPAAAEGEQEGRARGGDPAAGLRRAGGSEEVVVNAGAEAPGAGRREPTMTLAGWRRFVDSAPASFDLLAGQAVAGAIGRAAQPL